MKPFKLSRQNLYLLIITLFLLVFVLIFAFTVLIPSGKEYRQARAVTNRHSMELGEYEQLSDQTLGELKSLQEKYRNVITAFDNDFDENRFISQNKKYFQNLKVSKLSKMEEKQPFDLYEVNATSKIDSPVVFYNFLDSLNKSDWVIGVNFPIHFKRDGELINSSFTMRVYALSEDRNKTVSLKETNTTKQQ
ncbi:hypothetical protein [Sulfurimonas sp. HSL-1716]|uniref:hypothetical protein n=1 Tax=Hydrocurvibacter sulfurireducens TaxID=3131937 RepID=UPI0031F909DC